MHACIYNACICALVTFITSAHACARVPPGPSWHVQDLWACPSRGPPAGARPLSSPESASSKMFIGRHMSSWDRDIESASIGAGCAASARHPGSTCTQYVSDDERCSAAPDVQYYIVVVGGAPACMHWHASDMCGRQARVQRVQRRAEAEEGPGKKVTSPARSGPALFPYEGVAAREAAGGAAGQCLQGSRAGEREAPSAHPSCEASPAEKLGGKGRPSRANGNHDGTISGRVVRGGS